MSLLKITQRWRCGRPIVAVDDPALIGPPMTNTMGMVDVADLAGNATRRRRRADLQADQFDRQRRHPAIVAVRPAILHLEVCAPGQTALLEAFAKAASSRVEFSMERALMNPRPGRQFLRTGDERHDGQPAAPPISAMKSRRWGKPSPQSLHSPRIQAYFGARREGGGRKLTLGWCRRSLDEATGHIRAPKAMLADGAVSRGASILACHSGCAYVVTVKITDFGRFLFRCGVIFAGSARPERRAARAFVAPGRPRSAAHLR